MPNLKKQITSEVEAKAFIVALIDEGKDFHFEDSPETVINGKTGEPLFTESECVDVRRRVDELFEYLDDPFEILVDGCDHSETYFDNTLDTTRCAICNELRP